jgi:epoxyqueuosine reductase QueG
MSGLVRLRARLYIRDVASWSMKMRHPSAAYRDVDPDQAKQAIVEYCKKRGALAVGVADLAALERIAPPGHRPTDLMPRVKSVIALGVGGQTQGAWQLPAKAMAYSGSTETRAYGIAYGCAFFIEQRFGAPSIYVPPDMDPDGGPRVPLQSLKLHAEIAGIGARSFAGDILLHPQFGFMYYASVFTELALPADKPMEDNPCPAPSCVNMYRAIGRTPCMKFCPAQCLSGEIDAHGKQKTMRYDMAACAEFTQEFETVPKMLAEAVRDEARGADSLLDPDRKMLWYKVSAGSGGWFAQCFECMRVCPIATQAPQADPILRTEEQRTTVRKD